MPLRHCPLCGIAMQASKVRDSHPPLDRFECLTCGTTIDVPHRTPNRDRKP